MTRTNKQRKGYTMSDTERNFIWGIIGLIAFAMFMVGLHFEEVERAKVKVACYEAAKTNTNLKCEDVHN